MPHSKKNSFQITPPSGRASPSSHLPPPSSSSGSGTRRVPLYSHNEREGAEEGEFDDGGGGSASESGHQAARSQHNQTYQSSDSLRMSSANHGSLGRNPDNRHSASSSSQGYPILARHNQSTSRSAGPAASVVGASGGRPWIIGRNAGMRAGGLHNTDVEYDEYDGPDPDAKFFQIDKMRMDGSDSEDEDFPEYKPQSPQKQQSLSKRPSVKKRADGGTTSQDSNLSVTSPPVTGEGQKSYPGRNHSTTSTPPVDPTHEYTRSELREVHRQISDEVVPLLATPNSDEGRERLEWQTMLASVLEGEILKGEKSRIGGESSTSEKAYQKELGTAYWWEIRAKLRGRTALEETRRVNERRHRVVDAILEEVDRFKVDIPTDNVEQSAQIFEEATKKASEEGLNDPDVIETENEAANKAMSADQQALLQVLFILNKLSLAESLYPNRAAMMLEKPLYKTEAFQARVDAMSSWATNVRLVQSIVARLRQWTGSEELDVTKPNTNLEKPLVGSKFHQQQHLLGPGAGGNAMDAVRGRIDAADDSTFIERKLKEVSIEKLLQKKTLKELYSIVKNIKLSVIAHHVMLNELGLVEVSSTTFHPQVLLLIAFPCRLITAALRVRLNAAAKLSDPSLPVIEDMLVNMRMTLKAACKVKYEYQRTFESDPAHSWVIPHCIGEDFDDVLLDSLRTFFKILQWKLRSGGKAIYFKETDTLDEEWDFLYEIADEVQGGDVLVAELFW